MSEPVRDEATLRTILRTRSTALDAAKRGLQLAARSGGLPLGAAVVLGVIAGVVLYGAEQLTLELRTWEAASRTTGWQLGAAVTVFLVLYAIIQFMKRDTATVESWLPALFALPALCATVGVATAHVTSMPAADIFFTFSADMLFALLFTAPALILWIRAGQAAYEEREHDLGETLLQIRSETRRVMVIRAAKQQAVLVGAQVVLPGIFYMLQLAYAEIIAVLQPERPALQRSGQVSWGMRGRLFRLIMLFVVASNLLVVALLVLGSAVSGAGPLGQQIGAVLATYTMNPFAMGLGELVVQGVVISVAWWLTLLSVLVLFNEREAQIQAKRELRTLLDEKKQQEQGQSAESDATPA